jgi:hypothetical protein
MINTKCYRNLILILLTPAKREDTSKKSRRKRRAVVDNASNALHNDHCITCVRYSFEVCSVKILIILLTFFSSFYSFTFSLMFSSLAIRSP